MSKKIDMWPIQIQDSDLENNQGEKCREIWLTSGLRMVAVVFARLADIAPELLIPPKRPEGAYGGVLRHYAVIENSDENDGSDGLPRGARAKKVRLVTLEDIEPAKKTTG